MQDMKATPTAAAASNVFRAGTASAVALGAGLAGLSGAQAAVILTDVNATITDGIQEFDVNDDGVNELAILDETGLFSAAKGFGNTSLATDLFGGSSTVFLTRFYYGDTIDKGSFSNAKPNAFFYKSKTAGKSPWEDGERGFFGFAISSGAFPALDFSFGYVEAQFSPGNTVNIFRIGFQNTPNASITIRDANEVPAPGGIGLLALGAVGILALRRRQRKQAV